MNIISNYKIKSIDSKLESLDRKIEDERKQDDEIKIIKVVGEQLKSLESTFDEINKLGNKRSLNDKAVTDLTTVRKKAEGVYKKLLNINDIAMAKLHQSIHSQYEQVQADRFEAPKVKIEETKFLEARALELLRQAESMRRLANNFDIPDTDIANSIAKAKGLWLQINVLHRAQKGLELKFDSDMKRNLIFQEPYTFGERICLSSGCNGTTDRIRLQKTEGGDVESQYFVVKKPLINFSILGKGITDNEDINLKRLSNEQKFELMQIFGPGGSWTKYPLEKEDIQLLRKKLFYSEHAGKKLITDSGFEHLAKEKKNRGSAIEAIDTFGSNMEVPPENVAEFYSGGMHSLENELAISYILFCDGTENDHVAKTYCGGTDPIEGPYIVQEYAPGSTLDDFINKNGPLTFSSFIKFGAELLSGLAFLADKNIVHKDIKLDNIMKSETGKIKIIDLGEAICLNSPPDYNTAGVAGHWVPELKVASKNQAPWLNSLSPKVDCFMAGKALIDSISTEEEKKSMDVLIMNLGDRGVASTEEREQALKNSVENLIEKKFPHELPEEPKQKLVEVITGLLKINPQKRLSARQAEQQFMQMTVKA
jgi:serine/threonine protein kinase